MKKKFNIRYTLIGIFGIKECVFWKRTYNMHNKFNWVGKLSFFPISIILIAIAHYAFAFMHFLFETFLWIVCRGQFRINLNKMKTQLI